MKQTLINIAVVAVLLTLAKVAYGFIMLTLLFTSLGTLALHFAKDEIFALKDTAVTFAVDTWECFVTEVKKLLGSLK